MAPHRILNGLQNLLTGIYDVAQVPQVHQFLLNDAGALPAAEAQRDTDEQLLVSEDAQGMALGLYLDPKLLRRLGRADPQRALHGGNLADFWTALEGVSHFVYLAWNARHDRAVSLHELELQAEVDKYVCSTWLMLAQNPRRFPAELHRVLFERAHVDPRLAGERSGLYQRANQGAARFCHRLAGSLRARGAQAQALASTELRRFYRLTNAGKLHYIAGLG